MALAVVASRVTEPVPGQNDLWLGTIDTCGVVIVTEIGADGGLGHPFTVSDTV